MSEQSPAGVSKPPLTINDTDKRGVILVVSVVLLSFLLVSFLTRIWVRLRVSGPWSYDDTTLTVATVFGIAQSVTVFVEVHEGFGLSRDSLSAGAIANVGAADYASSVLYLVALCLSKCSVAALIMRLTSSHRHLVIDWIIMAVAIVWAVSSILLVTIKCSPAGPFENLEGQCAGLYARWKYVCALDIISEVSIFAMSIYFVAGLHMALKMKATVVQAFAIRLPVIAASAVRLHFLHRQIYSDDPTLDGYLAGVWTQVEVSYSLIATAAACLGPFIRPFGKPYLADATGSSRKQSHAPSAFHLSRITGKENSGSHPSQWGEIYPGRTHTTMVSHDPPKRRDQDDIAHDGVAPSRQSLDSHDSKRMIITKGVEWTVEYDGHDHHGRTQTAPSTESSSQI